MCTKELHCEGHNRFLSMTIFGPDKRWNFGKLMKVSGLTQILYSSCPLLVLSCV